MDNQRRAFRAAMKGCRDNTVLLNAVLRSGINNSSPLPPQLWTSQEPSTAWNTVPLCEQKKRLAFYLCWSNTSRTYTPAVPQSCRTQTGHQSLSKWREESSKGTHYSPVIFNLVINQLLRSLPQEWGFTYNGKTVPWPSRMIWFYSPTRQSVYNIYSTGRVSSWGRVAYS